MIEEREGQEETRVDKENKDMLVHVRDKHVFK